MQGPKECQRLSGLAKQTFRCDYTRPYPISWQAWLSNPGLPSTASMSDRRSAWTYGASDTVHSVKCAQWREAVYVAPYYDLL